jgi:hypothetical protein
MSFGVFGANIFMIAKIFSLLEKGVFYNWPCNLIFEL